MLSSFFHEAHEYFTYLHPHPLFFLTNFQTVWICISHGSWLGDAECSSEASAGGFHGDLQQDFNDDTTSGSLKLACLQGYFAAAKCEVGYADSQPRGRYQSLAQIEGLRVGVGKEVPPFTYLCTVASIENWCKAHVTFVLIWKHTCTLGEPVTKYTLVILKYSERIRAVIGMEVVS